MQKFEGHTRTKNVFVSFAVPISKTLMLCFTLFTVAAGPKKERTKKGSGGNKRPRLDGSDSELSESEYRKKAPKKSKKPFDSDSEDDFKSKSKKVNFYIAYR